MIDIEELQRKLMQRFMEDVDTESEIVEAILNCKSRDDFVKARNSYGIDKMKETCCKVYTTNIDPLNVFRHMKSCSSAVDFI